MGIEKRTHTLIRVLETLLDEADGDHYGLELARKARINPGSVYPILIRLESEGWVTSHWEDIDESSEGRRRRKYYRLTGIGSTAAFRELTMWEKRFSTLTPARPGAIS
jgi:PadR family transcriptional regulator, regulatory protein PadR